MRTTTLCPRNDPPPGRSLTSLRSPPLRGSSSSWLISTARRRRLVASPRREDRPCRVWRCCREPAPPKRQRRHRAAGGSFNAASLPRAPGRRLCSLSPPPETAAPPLRPVAAGLLRHPCRRPALCGHPCPQWPIISVVAAAFPSHPHRALRARRGGLPPPCVRPGPHAPSGARPSRTSQTDRYDLTQAPHRAYSARHAQTW